MTVALAWGMYGVVTGECLVSSEIRTVGTYQAYVPYQLIELHRRYVYWIGIHNKASRCSLIVVSQISCCKTMQLFVLSIISSLNFL